MFISNLAVKNRITVFVLTVILIISGLLCYFSMPREAEPEVVIPNIFISTGYRGVSPEDIEKTITKKIEEKLKGLEGIKKIVSVSGEGSSEINVEFIGGTDISKAEQEVKNKVDLAKPDLPSGIDDDPEVFDINLSELPFFIVALSGPCGPRELREIAEDLEEKVEGIPGILEVDVVGGKEHEIHVELDPDRMMIYGVPYGTLIDVVQRENLNVSGGSVKTGEGKYQIRLEGEFDSTDAAENIIVMMQGDGSPVYLRDIAEVNLGYKDQNDLSRVDGFDSVTLYIKKQSGENIIKISDRIMKVLDKAKAMWPPGTKMTILEDTSDRVKMMVADLENNIISGLILVIIVVCVAMGFRNAILVSLSIPLSMLIGFIILKMLDVTLNIVVLFSLTLALGMLVDNAIVIVENIYRFMQNGMSRTEAAMKATAEVSWPIIGSALTTVAAFIPMLWWGGVMGDFMVFLPKTVIVVLLSCLFVALVINPAMASVFMKVKAVSKNKKKSTLTIIPYYKRMLRHVLGFTYYETQGRDAISAKLLALCPRISVIICALLIFITMIMIWVYTVGLKTPIEFFPEGDPDKGVVTMVLPEGSDLAYCDQIAREVELRSFRENSVKNGMSQISYSEARKLKKQKYLNGLPYLSPSDMGNIESCYTKVDSINSKNEVTFIFPDIQQRTESSMTTMKRLADRMKALVGCEYTIDRPSHGPVKEAPINIEIHGDNMDMLGKIAKELKKLIRKVPFTENIKDDYTSGSPTINVSVNRQRAAFLGLTTGAIGFSLNAAINGLEVSEFHADNDDIDIIVRLKGKNRQLIETLNRIFLPSPTHGMIPLTAIANIEYVGGYGKIKRINHNRVVTVSADIDKTKTTGATARQQAQRLLKEANIKLPPGYQYYFTGENEEQDEASQFLMIAGLVAIMLIFLVLVSQFNSVIYPFIIMSSVFLSLGGVFLGLAVFGMPFGVIMTGVGVISLAGVVVNNAIVLIDYTIQLINEGMSRDEAIVQASSTRLRPVLLTAVTTVLGLIPMATGISWDFHPGSFGLQTVSETSQMWQNMAVSVIFGLFIATSLTLVVVPVLFSMLDDIIKLKIAMFNACVSGLKAIYNAYWRWVYKHLKIHP